MLPRWLWRLLAALVVALISLLVASGPASAFSSHHADTFLAFAYDHPDGSDILAGATTERGPPTTYDRDTTHVADDQWSSGASAHSDGSVPPAAIDYDHPDVLVQLARPTATTDASSFAFHCGRVAANPVTRQLDNCLTNSFTAETLVLMADGTRKPIQDVKLGDRVMATDPVTGERGPRKVVDLIRHGGLHTMVAVRLADGTTIDATDRHPFWVESRGEWVDAIDLQPGDVLVTAAGKRLTVATAGISTQNLRAYNLSVEGLHTYFVGDSEVLVHNCAMQKSPNALARAWGYSTKQIKTAIERVKQQPGWRGNGSNRNPDVFVDDATGEVYPKLPDGNPADDSIGNLYDYLPEEP